ncbi:ATP-grasp domain-containing protein [Kineosporia babensis]|uniref:ATP-grasp domain-containing protein n=1 Tax=Kineosporia babensis TaxID=499548 RepID=A0A9X1NMR3_9ACTN|nr:hypothetical protein [Kineosporia babensis]MCD5317018.1 hypothetical protein [Kineosporia babensis]
MSTRSGQRLSTEERAGLGSILELDLAGASLDEYEAHLPEILSWIREIDCDQQDLQVVALYEHTLRTAARLRSGLGLAGMSPEQVERCRDKVAMVRAVESHAPVVSTFPVDESTDAGAVVNWLHECGAGRVILKPRDGAASLGVVEFASVDAFRSGVAAGFTEELEVQPFIEKPICHLDGLIRDGVVTFLSVSRFVGDNLLYHRDRIPMGSAVMDRDAHRMGLDFASRVLTGLGVEDSAFHIEAFFEGTGFRMLEAAVRVGGINIQPHLRRVFEVDLTAEAFLAQCQEPSRLDGPVLACDRVPGSSGWLLVPRAEDEPCVVTDAQSPPDTGEFVLTADVFEPGRVLARQGVGVDAAAAFVLAAPGGDTEVVAAAVHRLAQQVKVSYRRLEEGSDGRD